ncbi:SDR family oxidoreductase [Nitratireductor luteus]|uniref:SDR family oxidoreductase n=1 Tax=Nitratireductor luteus TaxID=2976980 RepID=UPI002240042C|nr:SDR family oxidoreductase [Nitratireductor luteus]
MRTIIITGADMGLGFAFAEQYAEEGARVIAGCLNPSGGEIARLAKKYPNLTALKLDVTSDSSMAAFKDKVGDQAVDILINNAGVHYRKWSVPEEVVFADWEHTLQVNTIGPARVSFALRANLAKAGAARLVTISSDWGSVTNHPGTAYDYCSSKAAVNSLMRGMATRWHEDGITILMVHPGWTRTSMGGDNAPSTPEENARSVRKVIESMTTIDNGRYVDNAGIDLPW